MTFLSMFHFWSFAFFVFRFTKSITNLLAVLQALLLFCIIFLSLSLYPGRSVPSPWEFSSSLPLMVWPQTSRENLWTLALNHGDLTTSAIHGPTPASKYDMKWTWATQTVLCLKSLFENVLLSLVIECEVTVSSWASHGSYWWHHPQLI